MTESIANLKPLVGKTAVVTGSSSGIGRAIALDLSRAGATCIIHGRNQARATQAVAALRALGCDAQSMIADLQNPGEQDRLAETAWQQTAGVDIWINNAGADVLTGDAAALSFEEKLQLLWAVDVTATIRLSRNIGRRMRARGNGAIVNIGWDQALQGMAGDSGEMFTAIKGAVQAFTLSLAKSLAPQVRVNCLAPGWIRTAWGDQASDYWQQRASRESLLGRWGTPEDVAAAALFLVSPAAQFITGQTLCVNGGFRAS